MCLIVYKEDKDSKFSNRKFRNMINRNEDGLGIMWRENGRVKVEKFVGSKPKQYALWKKYRDLDTYAMHARMKTHGDIDVDNCHPYEILNIDKGDPIDLFMMHNGIISNAPEIDKKKSDTWHFIEHVIKPLAKANLEHVWEDEGFHQFIQSSIGASKLLFMRSDDAEHNVLILNHDKGVEEDGCWLSNTYSTVNHPKKPAVTQDKKKSPVNTTKTGGTAITHSVNRENPTEVDMERYYEETFSDHYKDGDLYLPNYTKDSKVIQLSDVKHITPADKEYFQSTIQTIRGLNSTWAVEQFVRDEIETVADLIEALYTESMPYENVIEACESDEGISAIADIVRHIATSQLSFIQQQKQA